MAANNAQFILSIPIVQVFTVHLFYFFEIAFILVGLVASTVPVSVHVREKVYRIHSGWCKVFGEDDDGECIQTNHSYIESTHTLRAQFGLIQVGEARC